MGTQPSPNGYKPSEHDVVALRPLLEDQLEKIVTTFTLHETLRALSRICYEKNAMLNLSNEVEVNLGTLWKRVGNVLDTLATGKAKTFGL